METLEIKAISCVLTYGLMRGVCVRIILFNLFDVSVILQKIAI